MPAEAPAAVQANVAPHLTSLGLPASTVGTIFQALAAAGYTVIPEGEPDAAAIVDTVTAERKMVEGVPGAFVVTVTDGDVELRWMEWHDKDGTLTRSNVTTVTPA